MTATKEIPPSSPSSSHGSMVHISSSTRDNGSASTSTIETTTSLTSSTRRARLLYCKSHVSIHPTQFNKDNVSGYLALVEAEREQSIDHVGQPQLIVAWVPDQVLQRMDKEDREGFERINSSSTLAQDEQDYVFISLPAPKGEQYAFSVPVTNIYSILVYPPSLQHWYGSATFNLLGGVSLPTLFFHDDESPMLAQAPSKTQARSKWGFPPFLSILRSHASLLRSRLLTERGGYKAELWLVNPSKADRDVHDAGIEGEEDLVAQEARLYPPERGFPDPKVLNTRSTAKQTLLSGFSNITSFSRKVSQQILAHPLAQEVVPHLPPAVRSLVNAPGEWDRSGRKRPTAKKERADVASEFESARLYLARWARVVAEEGEKARRDEVVRRAGTGNQNDVDDLSTSLGVFSLLPSADSKRPIPQPTRTPQHPITSRDWESYSAQGRDELFVRREIFRKGFSNSEDPSARKTRQEGWEILLGSLPWNIGRLGGGEGGRLERQNARETCRSAKRAEYERLRAKWQKDADLQGQESWKEEWHRIDVDCRRTDRSQPIFAIPREGVDHVGAATTSGGAIFATDDEKEEEGGMAKLNTHIAALRTILMTYHTYLPELGYVQGMSDLLSPIYVVFDANEADAFWGLVGVMKMMESNFLRDQSGMKRQLSMLQRLIGVMDPELYSHLDRTGSLNLFFCFRWILIAFKREFKFEDVINLWEVLWTNYYSDHFILFVALAILQSHRDVLIRYLTEFDEVLKYANDLSGTIDLQTTLNQAEVLFLQFKGLLEDAESLEDGKSQDGLRHRGGKANAQAGTDEYNERTKVLMELKELVRSS